MRQPFTLRQLRKILFHKSRGSLSDVICLSPPLSTRTHLKRDRQRRWMVTPMLRYSSSVLSITGLSSRSWLLIGLFLLLHARPAGAQHKEFIFEHAPFTSAHASTLVELRDGRYMAAWFGGTAEGATDVAIWASFRNASGWSSPQQMVREPQVPCWNPVLFHAADGRLWLYYKFGPTYTWWTAARRYSDDEGQTWSPVQHLPAGLIGPVRTNHCFCLRARWLAAPPWSLMAHGRHGSS